MAWTTPRTWAAGEVLTAALLNAHLRDNLDALGPAWTAVTFTNSWVDFGAPNQSVQYRKEGPDVVRIRGLMKSGTMSAGAFTLPSGFRPPNALHIGTTSNNAFGMFEINTAGVVTPTVGSNVWVSVTCAFSTRS